MNSKIFALVGIGLLAACTTMMVGPYDFTYMPVSGGEFEIATWQHLTNASDPIHIYIEGDGHAFDKHGRPTRNPTPRSNFVRHLASRDDAANVVYMARPCQYIRGSNCDVSDWTNGRFSKEVIDSMYTAVKNVAKGRPIVFVGYSGGAFVSGALIKKYPDLNVKKWVTIAGVLNHADWTEYFDDAPLDMSINMNGLPHVSQLHYIADGDKIVPNELTRKWAHPSDIIVINGARHDSFPDLTLNLD